MSDIIVQEEYSNDLNEVFVNIPDIIKPLMENAKEVLDNIENMLYTLPGLIELLEARVPRTMLEAVLTDEQKKKIAEGAIQLMVKKDGSLLAKLIDTKNKKIIANVPLKEIQITPDIDEALTNYAMQMQMAQIAEQIQVIQQAVEEVRQGQENDRLAIAYSCQQKLLQAIKLRNPELKNYALMQIASDAEDSRNLLMLSQKVNVDFIKSQPESFWKKVFSGADLKKVDTRINEVRESLYAVNMVSLAEAMSYQQMGEMDAACQSLIYYSEYIHNTYLKDERLLERLDMLDPSPDNYWSKELPVVAERILVLTENVERLKIGRENEMRKVQQRIAGRM